MDPKGLNNRTYPGDSGNLTDSSYLYCCLIAAALMILLRLYRCETLGSPFVCLIGQ